MAIKCVGITLALEREKVDGKGEADGVGKLLKREIRIEQMKSDGTKL